jgi:hypothetical protein
VRKAEDENFYCFHIVAIITHQSELTVGGVFSLNMTENGRNGHFCVGKWLLQILSMGLVLSSGILKAYLTRCKVRL